MDVLVGYSTGLKKEKTGINKKELAALNESIALGQECLSRWQKKVGHLELNHEAAYTIYMRPHKSRPSTCFDVGRGSVNYKDEKGNWNFSTYIESGYNDSEETPIACGDVLQDLLPSKNDGKILRILGTRIRIKNSKIEKYMTMVTKFNFNSFCKDELSYNFIEPDPYYGLDRWFLSGDELRDKLYQDDVDDNHVFGIVPKNDVYFNNVEEQLNASISSTQVLLDGIVEYRSVLKGKPMRLRSRHSKKRNKRF
jgi:hypothetical protein